MGNLKKTATMIIVINLIQKIVIALLINELLVITNLTDYIKFSIVFIITVILIINNISVNAKVN